MNANIRCLLLACENLGLPVQALHRSQNVVTVAVGGKRLLFVNASSPVNAHAFARLCKDKEYLYQYLEGAVRMPRTRGFLNPNVEDKFKKYLEYPSMAAVVEAMMAAFEVPFIVKRNAGGGGNNVFLCHAAEEAEAALAHIFDAHDKDYDYVALAQEYVEGRAEFRAIVYQDRVQFAFRKDTARYDNAEGTGTAAEALLPLRWEDAPATLLHDPALLGTLQDVVDQVAEVLPLPYAGLDLMLDDAQAWWLIEVNAAPDLKRFVHYNGEAEVVTLYEQMLRDCGGG